MSVYLDYGKPTSKTCSERAKSDTILKLFHKKGGSVDFLRINYYTRAGLVTKGTDICEVLNLSKYLEMGGNYKNFFTT